VALAGELTGLARLLLPKNTRAVVIRVRSQLGKDSLWCVICARGKSFNRFNQVIRYA
jgi:hypothetical protein